MLPTNLRDHNSQAGADWQQVYDFADEVNATVIGGYHQTVGAGCGWIMVIFITISH